MIKKLVLLFLTLFSLPALGMADFVKKPYSSLTSYAKAAANKNWLKRFLQKPETQQKVDDFYDSGIKWDDSIIPGFVVKRYQARVLGAEEFAKKINELGYTDIECATEFPYRGLVLSHKVTPNGEKITRTQAQHVYELAVALRWADAHANNFLKTKSNTITILDMELQKYSSVVSNKNVRGGVATSILLSTAQDSPYDTEALEFLSQEQQKYFPCTKNKFD